MSSTKAVSSATARLLDAARSLLETAPGDAVAPARALLQADPASAQARLLLGAALRRSGDPRAALEVLQPLAAATRAWGVQFEIGAAHALLGATSSAISTLSAALSLNPSALAARHALAEQRLASGDEVGAAADFAPFQQGQPFNLAFNDAVNPLFDGRFEAARRALLTRFGLSLHDPLVCVIAVDAALCAGVLRPAATLLDTLTARFPGYAPARRRLADVELRRRRAPEALAALTGGGWGEGDRSVHVELLRAAALAQTGAFEEAMATYSRILDERAGDPRIYLSRGHVAKALGRRADAASDYRLAIRVNPRFGEAYWALANLKNVPFLPSEVEMMERLFQDAGISAPDRSMLGFALGKAREALGATSSAFDAYAEGAAIRRAAAPFDRSAYRAGNVRLRAAATPALLAAPAAGPQAAPAPIFIVGLPRSGSTLVEQILASHSMIEGLFELPDLQIVIEDFIESLGVNGPKYPEALHSLPRERLLAAGAAYCARAARHRRTPRPFFTDKYPGNFHHLAFIHLAIPGARIIEVRRAPMACGFSLFRQNFAEGQDWTYDLGDIAVYMSEATALLDHVASVAPRRVIRVLYDDLVGCPEAEIRRLLGALGLDYEPACLDFHKNKRPVRTASSEQVREPLFTTGLDAWRRFEGPLQPLAAALRAEGLDPLI